MQHLKYVVGLTLSKLFPFFFDKYSRFWKHLQVPVYNKIYLLVREDIYKK